MTRHRLTDPSYLIRRAQDLCLGLALDQAAARLAGGGELRLFDIGGRGRPHAPLVASRLAATGRVIRHIAIDAGSGADVLGAAEALPAASRSADLVLCTQVLEHVADPELAVREMRRVLKPGGCCILTTHGNWFYHPDPDDHWRWTSTGLGLLFERAGMAGIQVRPVGGSALALAVLALNAARSRAGEGTPGWIACRLLVAPVNALASGLLLRRASHRANLPGDLAINYIVSAVAP